jgi:(-)-alpha-terpineol synthase
MNVMLLIAEVFNNFKDERKNFKACLCEDTKGMLSLYEASFLSIEGENILDEARDFSAKHLEEYVKQNKDKNLSTTVSHALEIPLHWRMLRLEARWFIDIYRRREDMNPILLELAELDFNMVQATHQEDLKQVSRLAT